MQGYIQLIKSPEGAGRADCFPLSFFSFFCRSVELQETQGLGRKDEVGGRLLGAGSRGRG